MLLPNKRNDDASRTTRLRRRQIKEKYALIKHAFSDLREHGYKVSYTYHIEHLQGSAQHGIFIVDVSKDRQRAMHVVVTLPAKGGDFMSPPDDAQVLRITLLPTDEVILLHLRNWLGGHLSRLLSHLGLHPSNVAVDVKGRRHRSREEVA